MKYVPYIQNLRMRARNKEINKTFSLPDRICRGGGKKRFFSSA